MKHDERFDYNLKVHKAAKKQLRLEGFFFHFTRKLFRKKNVLLIQI